MNRAWLDWRERLARGRRRVARAARGSASRDWFEFETLGGRAHDLRLGATMCLPNSENEIVNIDGIAIYGMERLIADQRVGPSLRREAHFSLITIGEALKERPS